MFTYPLNTRFFSAVLAASLLVSVSGCGPRLSVEKSVSIKPSEVRTVMIDPIGREQTIKVKASSAVSFNVHVYLTKDDTDVERAIMSRKESAKNLEKILAGESGVTEAELEALVPANEEAVIRFECAGSEGVTVDYSISN